jgi:hypothetical protein
MTAHLQVALRVHEYDAKVGDVPLGLRWRDHQRPKHVSVPAGLVEQEATKRVMMSLQVIRLLCHGLSLEQLPKSLAAWVKQYSRWLPGSVSVDDFDMACDPALHVPPAPRRNARELLKSLPVLRSMCPAQHGC